MARGSPGFSGADLANLINQAALRGSALGREAVLHEDLDFAKLVMYSQRNNILVVNFLISCFLYMHMHLHRHGQACV